MTPKKKTAPTSSESNSSSTSSSSTSSTSSSSSGSDSSSSDSDNSSTSQASAVKCGGHAGSPDSENKKVAKKKPVPGTKAKDVRPKSRLSAVAKNRPAKTSAQIYSSESEATPKSRLSLTAKGRPTKATAPVYSSESEEPLAVKASAKRKALAKPKPVATVTAVPKQVKQPKTTAVPQKTTNAKVPVKARKPPEKDASKSAKDTAAQKKPKSIFSPENSSDSDHYTPMKLAPMKSCATKTIAKLKPKAKAGATATATANNWGSSHGTSSSSCSSDSEESGFQGGTKKKTKRKATGGPENDRKRPAVRKLTRSSSARRSKHLVGKASDSESEPEAKVAAKQASRANKSPRKARGRCSKSEVPSGERNCPLEGCDSSGHLGGRHDRHFTMEACPRYHNKTLQECKEAATERLRKIDERTKAVSSLASGKPNQLTQEHKNYIALVKDLRQPNSLSSEQDRNNSDVSMHDKICQPLLKGVSPEYDLKLFWEAEAVASEKMEEDLESLPYLKGTKYIEMGKFEMEVWYQSPYPEDFARVPKLYLCEYCLRYMKSGTILTRHSAKCVWRHPPGEEVYRKEKISVWEVDGKRYKQYCQNLCLLAKFFLDHKTLYYDVEPFLFYVMTMGDSEGCHTVGYFSKEKNSFLNYNVSCILTLPPYQRQGYGRLLIDFSYLLTRVEGKIGSPEKPLSDLGLISYRSYWKDVLLEYLCNFGGKQLSIKDISQEMAINSYDIVSTLQALGMMKYWKGKHIILKKQDVIDEYVDRTQRRGSVYKEIDPAFLKWTPFVAPAPVGPI